ncbi:MAG: respiratory chain complex I subunit 1 family protein [Fimbriimonadales bacterium]
MTIVELILFQAINLLVIPLLLVGVVRKAKARMQMRVGAPVLQPFYDIAKAIRKSETISDTASWVFIWAPRVGLGVVAMLAVLVPWAGPLLPPAWSPASNFLFVLYLLALGRFFALLAALDTGSAFGGLGASREAMISMLVEPTLVIGLAAMAVRSGSADLQTMFALASSPVVAVLAGLALFLASLAELSRMPVDDPTTHLELTMVHEAMVLENSGTSLALIEYASAVRMCVFFGLATQAFLHAWPGFHDLSLGLQYAIGVICLFAAGIILAGAEGIAVKLKWRSVPNFLAFAAVSSFLAALIAVTQR